MQDAIRKIDQARALVLDAKKHDSALSIFGGKLLEDIESLPPYLKNSIKLSEQLELFISESIAQQLQSIAVNLIQLRGSSKENQSKNLAIF